MKQNKKTTKQNTIYKVTMKPSANQEEVGLDLRLPASRTARSKCLLLKPPT
jgi:hypothetical protein